MKTPQGLSIYRATQDELEGRLWLLFRGILWKMHLVSHTPKRMDHRRPSICAGKGANVITSECRLDTSYGLAHIQASCSTNRSKKIQGIPQKTRFYAVPAGFDEWRISFSMAGREILATSHDGFKAGYK